MSYDYDCSGAEEQENPDTLEEPGLLPTLWRANLCTKSGYVAQGRMGQTSGTTTPVCGSTTVAQLRSVCRTPTTSQNQPPVMCH